MIEDELKYQDFKFKITLLHRNALKTPTTVIKLYFERPGYLSKQLCDKDSSVSRIDYYDLCKIIDLRHSFVDEKTSKSD